MSVEWPYPSGYGQVELLEIERELMRGATIVLADMLPAAEAVAWIGVHEHSFGYGCRRTARMASTHGR